jgi:xanthine/uracil permease
VMNYVKNIGLYHVTKRYYFIKTPNKSIFLILKSFVQNLKQTLKSVPVFVTDMNRGTPNLAAE